MAGKNDSDSTWAIQTMEGNNFKSITILMFIAAGALAFFILFMCVKRQIARFVARSKYSPHYPIGENANKALNIEIMRRLACVPKIKYEPKLWTHKSQEVKTAKTRKTSTYEWRMRAVDAVDILDEELVYLDPDLFRPPGSSLRLFLMELIQKHYLEESFTPIIQDFCNRYDHARYGSEPFLEPEYNGYMGLLDKLIVAIRTTHAIVSIPPEKRFYSSSGGCGGNLGSGAGGADSRRHPDSPERAGGGGGARMFRDKKRVVQTAASTLIRNVMIRSKSDPADLANPADVAALTNQFVRFRSKKSPSSIEEETPNEMVDL